MATRVKNDRLEEGCSQMRCSHSTRLLPEKDPIPQQLRSSVLKAQINTVFLAVDFDQIHE